MGSLALEDYDLAAVNMYTESDLLDPPFFPSDWSSQSASIFDCSGGLTKDWNSTQLPPLLTSSSSSLSAAAASVSTSTAAAANPHDHSGLYIDPCCDFGDVFGGYQTTPISVLDYVQSSSSLDDHCSFSGTGGSGLFTTAQDDPDIQELLAGFNQQHQQQEQEVFHHKVEAHPPGAGGFCTSPSMSSQGSSFTPPQMMKPEPPVFISPKLEPRDVQNYHHQQQQQQMNQGVVLKQEEQQQQPIIIHQQQELNCSNPYLPKFEPVDRQLRLVRMLLSCAAAVAEGNVDVAGATLVQLRGMVVPHGSPMERLASYVTEALVARLSRNTRSSMFQGLVCDKLQQLSSTTRSDMLEAFWVFYEYVPIGKFTHLTMNQILLDAADRERSIHVIDFQVWYGAQWPSFLQSLALRPGGPPMLRMTAVGSSLRDLQEAGSKLLDCARSLGVPFEYCLLNVELEQFHAGMIELRDGEAVLVNSLCQFHCFLKRDEAFVEAFLQGLRALRPRIVVMAENDADHNSPVFLNRFMSCLQYYSAVFDAFDASLHMPATLRGRRKLEELIAAQKLRNMIACEGSERVERHESMQAWNSRMEAAGFRAVSMSSKAVNQASLLLRLYFSNGYTLTNEDGFLILGWRGMPLNGVGAWI